MMKTANRIILSAAAASMALLPVAAQANTRAGDSGAIYSTSAPGLGRAAEGEKVAGGFGILIAIFGVAAVIGGIVAATELAGDDDDQSPGT